MLTQGTITWQEDFFAGAHAGLLSSSPSPILFLGLTYHGARSGQMMMSEKYKMYIGF